jgi:hypothetical protein
MKRPWLVGATVLLIAPGCTGPDTESNTRPSKAVADDTAHVVGCDAAIGGGQPSPGWRNYAVVVGPLTFTGVKEIKPADRAFVSVRCRYEGLKVPLLIETGLPVRLVISAEEVDRLSLLYDPDTWSPSRNGLYRVSDGNPAVAFEACQPPTWFAGGFVVADGPRCIALDAYIGRSTQPEQVILPLGVPNCST